MRLLLAIPVMLLLLSAFSYAATNVTSCMQINSSGAYVLQNDLSGAGTPANPNSVFTDVCIRISSPDVVLDCAGHSITGNGTEDIGVTSDEEPTHLSNITVMNCDVSNYHIGIYSLDNNDSLWQNNTAHGNAFAGIFLTGLLDSNATLNHANGNSGEGMFVYGSGNNLSLNTVCGNTGNGFRMTGFYSTANDSFYGNTVCNNTAEGMYASLSSGLLTIYSSGNHFYNNGHDVGIYANASLQMSGDIFDNPAGSMKNYTVLSVSDASTSGGYTMAWSSAPAPLPSGYVPFGGRFLNISQATSGESIDSATWSWSDGEPVAVFEGIFQLWSYDAGGWTALNTTPDTSANTLSLSGFAPASVYSVMLNATCPPPITAPGSYSLASNAAGEPNDASDISGGAMACVKIEAPNVAFDCNGYNITGDNSSPISFGIALNGSASNVSITNCPGISGFYTGVRGQSDDVNVTSVTAFGNSQDGIQLSPSSGSRVIGVIAYQNGLNGIETAGSGNTINGNIPYNNTQFGIAAYPGSTGVTIIGNIPYDNGVHGIWSAADFTFAEGNIAYGNGQDGIRIENGNNATIYGNIFQDNGYSGIGLLGSSGDNVTSNDAYGNLVYGLEVSSGSSNLITSNYLYSNGNSGMDLFQASSSGNVLTGNSMYSNNQTGLTIDGSHDNMVSGNSIYNNTDEGVLLRGDNNTLSGNNVSGNGGYGVRFYQSSGNSLADGLVQENALFDLFVYATDPSQCGNSVSNITASGGRPLNYTNVPVSWSGFTSSELVLCDADGSNVSDANISGSDTLFNNGVLLVQTDNATISGTNSSNNLIGFENDFGSNVTIDGSEARNDFEAGFGEFTLTTPASTLANTVLADNGWDILQESSNSVLFTVDHSLLGNVSDPSSVNLTISDEVGSGGGGYSIKKASSPGPDPAGLASFHGKYFKILFTGDLGINYTSISIAGSSMSGFNYPISLYAWTGSNWSLVPNQVYDTAGARVNVTSLINITSDDIYGLFAPAATSVPGGGPSGGGGTGPALEIAYDTSTGIATITSGGDPVPGATVKDDGSLLGTTDSGGQIAVPGCGSDVSLDALKSGYSAASVTVSLMACGVPECTSDQNCSSSESCSAGQCVSVSCPGGSVVDHACVMPQNGTNQTCVSPSCCTDSSQCSDSQACVTPSGAPATASAPGSCQEVTGQCGFAQGHAFVPYNYTCGSEPGCPSCPLGQSCVSHQCVSSDITCPSSGLVGDQVTCRTTQAGAACGPSDNCTATVTSPDGKKLTANPDDNGNVQVPLTMAGNYTITLLKDGQAVKTIKVSANPKTAPQEQQPPTASGFDAASALWLVILLIVIIAAFLYWRSRKK